MARRGCQGQQTTEFVLVIGIAAVVAIGMQAVARRTMQTGMRHVSDTVLGAPPAPPPNPGTTPPRQEMQAESGRTLIEQGSPGFQRLTTTTETVSGHSVNEETRFRVIPEPNR